MHVYESMGIGYEPAFLYSHPRFVGEGESRPLHIALAESLDGTCLSLAALDPVGEVWSYSCRSVGRKRTVQALVGEFVNQCVPKIENVLWSVVLLDCGLVNGLEQLVSGLRPHEHIQSVETASVHRNGIFKMESESSTHRYARVGPDAFLLAHGSESLLVESKSQNWVEQLLLLMGLDLASGLPKHVAFVWDTLLE